MAKFTDGAIVMNPKAPGWGPGKILAVDGPTVVAFWRDVIETKPGDAVKRINTTVVGLELAPSQSDPILDNLPSYDDLKRGKSRRLTWDEGIQFFLKKCPKGFADPVYRANERDYKWAAHKTFEEHFGTDQYANFVKAGDLDSLRDHTLHVASKVNLLSLYESAAFRDALKDDNAAWAYFESLGPVLDARRAERTTFENYIRSVSELPVTGKVSPAKWPVLTLLPFIGRPDAYMFLKPEVTKGCADRLAFNLNYSPQVNWLTYSRLLGMSYLLLERLAPLGAVDFIDVQSFIWVIGSYT